MFYAYSWLLSWFYYLHKVRLFLIFIAALLPNHGASAANIDEIIVTEEAGIYHISVTAEIAATEKFVRQVITDYVHAYRINSSIVASEVLASPVKGNIRVKARVLSCIPLFCRVAERVDEVSTLASGDIQAVIVPEESDFYSGKALWKIAPDGNKTQLVYLASIEPSFFIPPVLGTRLVIENLRDQLSTTFFRIEQVAVINEEREWNDDLGVATVVSRKDVLPCDDMVSVD